MFIVVSKWEPHVDKLAEWETMSAGTRQRLLSIPGVEFMHRFKNDQGQFVVSMGYSDRPTYESLVNDPNGAVARAMAQNDLEKLGRWISSERGESVD